MKKIAIFIILLFFIGCKEIDYKDKIENVKIGDVLDLNKEYYLWMDNFSTWWKPELYKANAKNKVYVIGYSYRRKSYFISVDANTNVINAIWVKQLE